MNKLFIFLTSLLVICFYSCSDKDVILQKYQGKAQGTTYSICYIHKDGISFHNEIDSLFQRIDKSMSLYDSNSIISRINRNDTKVKVDVFFEYVFNKSKEISKKTNGAFDVTIGTLLDEGNILNRSGRTQDDSFVKKYVNYKNVQIKNQRIIKKYAETKLNFNGIAQGYMVDVIADFLEKKGVCNYLVEIGGEIKVKGKKTNDIFWEIGIEKPTYNENEQILQVVFPLTDRAISTSGIYRNYFEKNNIKYSHIINPKNGNSIQNELLSVTVFANDCLTADAYSTAFMVLGLKKSLSILKNNKKIDALFIYNSNGKETVCATKKAYKFINNKNIYLCE